MLIAHQSDEELTPEMLNPPLGWEEIEEQKQTKRAMEYLLSMTPAQRLARHEEAAVVALRLNAIAEKFGLRSMGWRISGPSPRRLRRRRWCRAGDAQV
jgi:hypothetical protein